jgi:hypothetical protein
VCARDRTASLAEYGPRDENVARKLVAMRADQGLADRSAFGTLGAPDIPLLREALSQVGTGEQEDNRRAALTKCLRATLGFVGAPQRRRWPGSASTCWSAAT